MEIFDKIEQGSEEWFSLRIGSIGGSSISSVVAGGKGIMRKNLLYRLAGEILSGQKYESYQNEHMLRGLEQEAEARSLYEMMKDVDVQQVGLVKGSEHRHYSPDGLVGDDGLLEIKSTIPSIHIETIIQNEIPPEYRKQCQWGLFICQRRWVDFVSYSPFVADKPILIIRAGRDESLIKELDEGADKFIMDMAVVIKKVKGK